MAEKVESASAHREDLIDEAKTLERLYRAGMVDDAARFNFTDPKDRDLDDRMVHRMYGSCTNPPRIPYAKFQDQELAVRCRNCPGCLRARRTLWRYRAEEEFLLSPRTWFFTGTFRNQTDDMVRVKRETTMFLTRLRRRMEYLQKQGLEAGELPLYGNLRYIVAPEPHKSGMLHIHALLHTGTAVTRRMISESWKAGHEKTKIAQLEHAGYVTKYVTKNLVEKRAHRPRVRASRDPRYGDAVMITNEIMLAEMIRMLQKRKTMRGDVWLKNLRMTLMEVAKTRPENQTVWEKIISLEYNENFLELERNSYGTL